MILPLVMVLAGLFLAGGGIALANRLRRPDFGACTVKGGARDLPAASAELAVTTWNIGYAGLGQRADFFADHGRSVRALSRAEISEAADRIAESLTERQQDLILLQENAKAGFLTRGIDVSRRIMRALAPMRHAYWADMKTVLLPVQLRLDHGMSIFSRLRDRGCAIVRLPQTDSYYYGFIKKYYVGQMVRYPIAGTGKDWVVINLHLSAFDAGGRVRMAQLDQLFAVAAAEYGKGHHVVIGGDWNMRLCATDFAHMTDTPYLDWLVDLPPQALPAGWQLAVDMRTPTVRTMQAPYVAGQTYTTIIDGFAVSPNVDVKKVTTRDFAFAFTDHHPVEAVFAARPSGGDA